MRSAPSRAWADVVEVVRLTVVEFPAPWLRAVRRYRSTRSRSAAAVRADVILTARVHGWDEAAVRFEAAPGTVPFAETVLASRHAPVPVPIASPLVPRDADLSPLLAERIVVYTARFGDTGALPPVHVRPEGVRFVCFTDRERSDPDWEISLVDTTGDDPVRDRAWHRINADAALQGVAPETDWSLYVDPDTILVGNLHTLFTRWLPAHDVVMFRDRSAAGWWDLAERHVLRGAAPRQVMSRAMSEVFADLERRNVPRDSGAHDTSIIWRRHGEPAVVELMQRWWTAASTFPLFDDVALVVALETSEGTIGDAAVTMARPEVLPRALGDAHDSWFAAAVPAHGLVGSHTTRRRTTRPGRTRTKIAFLRDPVANQEITTTLRGQQLSRLIARRCPEYDVVYTDDKDSLSDHVVILLKQTLQHLSPGEIEQLGRRNVAVVNCWDDQAPDRDRVLAADAQMVLAFGQLVELQRRYPERPTYLVTHHVNLDFPRGCPPQDRLRVGYFGAACNTRLPSTLLDAVELVPTAVLAGDDSPHWMHRLADYNCHWAIRQRQYWDGWKPFLKGFVAARYGAPVVVAPDDDDARYFLGDDYPFYATGKSDQDLELLVVTMQAAFGGPEWELARAIMRQVADRSSNDTVCADFRRMVDQLAG